MIRINFFQDSKSAGSPGVVQIGNGNKNFGSGDGKMLQVQIEDERQAPKLMRKSNRPKVTDPPMFADNEFDFDDEKTTQWPGGLQAMNQVLESTTTEDLITTLADTTESYDSSQMTTEKPENITTTEDITTVEITTELPTTENLPQQNLQRRLNQDKNPTTKKPSKNEKSEMTTENYDATTTIKDFTTISPFLTTISNIETTTDPNESTTNPGETTTFESTTFDLDDRIDTTVIKTLLG